MIRIERIKNCAGVDELFHPAVTAAAHTSVLAQVMTLIAEMILETGMESQR